MCSVVWWNQPCSVAASKRVFCQHPNPIKSFAVKELNSVWPPREEKHGQKTGEPSHHCDISVEWKVLLVGHKCEKWLLSPPIRSVPPRPLFCGVVCRFSQSEQEKNLENYNNQSIYRIASLRKAVKNSLEANHS